MFKGLQIETTERWEEKLRRIHFTKWSGQKSIFEKFNWWANLELSMNKKSYKLD